MDTRKPRIYARNTPLCHSTTLPDTTGATKADIPRCSGSTIPSDQPLLKRYRHILEKTKQGPEGKLVHSPVVASHRPLQGYVILRYIFAVYETMPHLAPPLSQAPIDTSLAIKMWIEGESDYDHEGNSQTTSKTSSIRYPETTATNPLYPVAPGVYPPMTDLEVAEALYGPFSRPNDYASQVDTLSAPLQDTTQDVEMEDSDDKFENEVMIYYHAAIASSGSDTIFDATFPTFKNSHVSPPDSV